MVIKNNKENIAVACDRENKLSADPAAGKQDNSYFQHTKV